MMVVGMGAYPGTNLTGTMGQLYSFINVLLCAGVEVLQAGFEGLAFTGQRTGS
jgi:hypothetical protein